MSRAELVPRPRLTEQFAAALKHPLTLICAPAGFGKTTLISGWAGSEAASEFPLAWLSLDEDDSDPACFLTYLISTLENIGDISSQDLLSLLHSPQPPPPKAILTALISRLEKLPHRFALALDDYHRIGSQSLHEALIFLIEHMPAQMRLVLISREDPPLPLSRLRGRGQLSEIRADDLRFTHDEAALFLQQMLGIELSVSQVKELDTRTEGWIAGLQLAALAMKGRKDIAAFITAFTGNHRYVLDYLTDEVMSRQPETMQRFLLQTSILERMNGSLCDAVMGGSDGQAALEQIEHENLFLISLDDERSWYRYHHLFGDMLRQRLQQSRPELVPELHQRASAWFEQEGWVSEAVEHAFLGQDSNRAARLLELHSEHLWRHGQLTTVLRWLRALPEQALAARPKLGLNYAFMLTLNDIHAQAEERVAVVERVLSRQDSGPEQIALWGQAAAIRATIYLRLPDKSHLALDAGLQALAQLPESEVQWRGWVMTSIGVAYYDIVGDVVESERYMIEALDLSAKANDLFTHVAALSTLTRMYIFRGRLRQAEVMAERLLQLAANSGWEDQASIDRCRVRYEKNDVQGALADILEAQKMAEAYSHTRLLIEANVLLARIQQTLGRENEARALMQKTVDTLQTNYRQTYYSYSWLFTSQAWLWLTQGDLDSAARWAQSVEPIHIDQPDPAREFERTTLARVQIAQGRLDEAQQLLAHLFAGAENSGRIGRLIGIVVLQAIADRQQGHLEQALDRLEGALNLAQPDGHIRVFLDGGEPIYNLLKTLQKRGHATEFVRELLAAFEPDTAQKPPTSDQDWIGERIEPLSDRELEVLRLLVDGASNRDIAEQLVVSIGTVKKHLNNIFTKLDASSRTQAIAAARKYNLV